MTPRITRAAIAAGTAVAVLLAPTAAYADSHTVRPRSGEGLIALTKRTCGSSSTWRAQAQANGVRPASYTIYFGRSYVINCDAKPKPAVRRDDRASRSTARRSGAWVHPLPGNPLTSCWGAGRGHKGLDIDGVTGEPVRAAAAGTVVRAGWLWSGYGISVVIDHGAWVTHYAHLSGERVSAGQDVTVGQVIGRVGSTGDSTGSHLHLEVASTRGVLGHQVNPAPFLRARGVHIGC
jgi:murein DD-endopeptidase MepM/ murein hydrolase activator NlpD